MESFVCATCGQTHDGLPKAFGPPAPDPWFAIPEEKRSLRAQLSDDLCVLDNRHWFIRGCVDIPILGTEDCFTWIVWASLSQANFDRFLSRWEAEGREEDPPAFGWLSTRIHCYPDTWLLKTNVYTNPIGARPSVVLEPTDHPLAVEQRDGITPRRASELATRALHG
jgi:hypothetical protein